MGKVRNSGVRARSGSIQIDFRYNNERCRETVPIEPTAANLKHAANLRGEILHKIALGTFNYAEYFPNSERAKKYTQPVLAVTFTQYAELYLKSLEHEKGTFTQYRNQLLNRWIPIFGDRRINEIRYSEISSTIGGIEWASAKTRNNNLIPLRAVFEMAYMDGVIESNPLNRIKNQRVQKDPPDPFSKEEADQIIEHMREAYTPEISNYFEFAFYTGLRIEELVALKWSDYDKNTRQVRVQRARSYGEVKNTKTNKIRDIDLNARAITALERQKAYTFFRADEYVFVNPTTNNPWADTHQVQRVSYWNPTIKKLGIRRRQQKQTRHTYATMLLMSGANLAYAASQMGHSVQVLLKDYARWINTAGQLAEREKMRDFLELGHMTVTR